VHPLLGWMKDDRGFFQFGFNDVDRDLVNLTQKFVVAI
jgi:hypothetical protein